jgi:hypothetical protein
MVPAATPALAAICGIAVPWNPRSTKHSSTAAMMASRRSGTGGRPRFAVPANSRTIIRIISARCPDQRKNGLQTPTEHAFVRIDIFERTFIPRSHAMPKRPTLALLSLAFASAACDLDLPPGDVKSPDYWGDFFLDKYADELVLQELEPGPTPLAEPRVVLLITGVTIPAEWFEPMKARLVRDGFIPVVYEPPELLSGDLFENSELLGQVIDQVRADYGQDKIDILAECTGGLIARHYIQSLDGASKVSRLVTFISPQHGVDKAPWAAAIAGWPALYDLSPGSEFLAAVNEAPMAEDVPVTSIYSCTDEYIQPYETSIIPGAENIGLCDEFVGHFQFFWDPEIYLIMHGALTKPLAADGDAPEDPADAGEPEEPADAGEPADDGVEPPAADDADDPGEADDDAALACAVAHGGGRTAAPLWLVGAGALVLRRGRRRRDQ